ncbi:hypothetical protein MC7420_3978 [Coleofasciculus chthonoplastes PCC 7420]|uniref:Uncharacterized protein n=1 Tax=Coleofasciculus chthonoplastes PCC 7420 TaxID=118168 RepID=B4VUH9_9CYAN|nr:hypothetical protein MC7420_3978 [Coleofasciculus chthonoplastes PCC 7420]
MSVSQKASSGELMGISLSYSESRCSLIMSSGTFNHQRNLGFE